MSEGADMIMVKPGMPYLDIVRQVKDQVSESIVPLSRLICSQLCSPCRQLWPKYFFHHDRTELGNANFTLCPK